MKTTTKAIVSQTNHCRRLIAISRPPAQTPLLGFPPDTTLPVWAIRGQPAQIRTIASWSGVLHRSGRTLTQQNHTALLRHRRSQERNRCSATLTGQLSGLGALVGGQRGGDRDRVRPATHGAG